MGWVTPPLFSSTAKLDPTRNLNQRELLDAMYIASPAGLSQLTEVLHRRGVHFTGDDLQRELAEGMRTGAVTICELRMGDASVHLYARRGLSR